MQTEMGSHFSIELSDRESPEVKEIQSRLIEFNRQFVPQDERRDLNLFVRGSAPLAGPGSSGENLVAGLCGSTNWGWLYVRLLWVEDKLRGQGLGEHLMSAAQEEARRRGCSAAWVDTFSPEAAKFYQRLGYEIFGELSDCPPGGRRIFLRKQW